MIIIKAYGDPNIRATHKTTIEITKDDHLTERGDCILGIRADRGLKDIKNFLDSHIGKKLIVEFTVDDLSDRVTGYLDPRLSFLDKRDIVIRKSSYICKRTLMINADKSAAEIDRSIVRKLREGKELIVRINSV